MLPNANLTSLHLIGFTVCLIAIYGWGLYCLEHQLARAAGTAMIAAAK